MDKDEKDRETGYETNDFIPGTDVLAVERKETGQDAAETTRQYEAAVVLEVVQGPRIPDQSVTDRTESDPKPPRRPKKTQRT